MNDAPRLWHACTHCSRPLREHAVAWQDCRVTLQPCDECLRANWPDMFAEAIVRADGVSICADCLRPIRAHLTFETPVIEILGTVIVAGAGRECRWDLPGEWVECGATP